MSPEQRGALEQFTKEIREELDRGMGCYSRLHVPGLRSPLLLDVAPDGITWLVRVEYEGVGLYRDDLTVDPKAFAANLYVFLVAIVKAVSAPKAKAS